MMRTLSLSLLLASLAACSGGSSTLAPGASSASGGTLPAAPLTLTVSPAQATFASVGQTVGITVAASSGTSGVPISYAGGCDGIASVSPTKQKTDASGRAAFVATSVKVAACTAQFSAPGASAPLPISTASPRSHRGT